jgi:hypothetical protein
MSLKLRDELAYTIIAGICAGDWQFQIPEGKTWDEVAARRAYELADAMLREREVTYVYDAKTKDEVGEE